jgi:hypothetical protein
MYVTGAPTCRDFARDFRRVLRQEQYHAIHDVLGRLPSETIDLLQIDTEGADAYIFVPIPF